MPRQTRKYVTALETAERLNIPPLDNPESLYSTLNQQNFFWESGEGRWVPGSEPEAATELIRIRVWAESSKVQEVANTVVRRLSGAGYALVEKSEPYICRPPKQAESRVYLTFKEEP